ncbi:MAG: tRNA uridine-5-carboxymethylaminomethyl(34) synthesis GTPase MnmE [Burkholderiales bacterium]
MQHTDTIAAIATAPGRGAVGVVRVSGVDLSRVMKGMLGGTPPPRRAVLRVFTDDEGTAIDQGIAVYFPAPHSYTGEQVLELQGHGGPVVMVQLLRRCVALGARVAEPGEFTRRAFLNGKIDLAQAEGVADLIEATTEKAARCALRSLTGEFSRTTESVASELIELRALVEATLDFPDEEIDFLQGTDARGRLSRIRERLSDTFLAARRGGVLRDGINVVLVGRPNVGKSSLLNRLAGEDIAIVTDVPGTTRDPIRQALQIRGIPLHVVDTAGLRESVDPVEQAGMGRTWSAIERADVVVVISEAHGLGAEAGDDVLARLPNRLPRVDVTNKIDLTPEQPIVRRRGKLVEVRLSALTGQGISLLEGALLDAVGWADEGEGLFMARARHLDALRAAENHLTLAADEREHLELMAEQLRLAQKELASITGEYTSDDLLGDIFSRFCMGK